MLLNNLQLNLYVDGMVIVNSKIFYIITVVNENLGSRPSAFQFALFQRMVNYENKLLFLLVDITDTILNLIQFSKHLNTCSALWHRIMCYVLMDECIYVYICGCTYMYLTHRVYGSCF